MVTQNPAALRAGDWLEPGTYRVDKKSSHPAAGSTITVRASLEVGGWDCVLVDGRSINKATLTPVRPDGPMPADDEPDEGEGDEAPPPGCLGCQLGGEHGSRRHDEGFAANVTTVGGINLTTEIAEPARPPHALYWADADGALRPVDDFDDEPESYELTLLRAALHWHAETLP